MDVSESTKRSPSPLSRDEGGGFKGKVCVVCRCDRVYTLFILDFDAAAAAAAAIDKFIETPPTLQFEPDDFGILSFCVSGTRLYVIGADDDEGYPFYKNTWMSEYDLKPPPPSSFLMSAAELKNYRVPQMNTEKCYPIAVTAPGGRILVYSKFLSYFGLYALSPEYFDFELYDPRQKQWQKLPQLYLKASRDRGKHELFLHDNSGKWVQHPGGPFLKNWPLHDYDDFKCIVAGSFINGTSTFLLTLRVGLMFTLDLTSVEKGWKAYYDHPSLFLDILSPRGFVDDEFLVVEPILETSYWVKGLKDGQKVPRPDVPPPGTYYDFFERDRFPDVKIIALKYVGGDEYVGGHECFTCTVTSGYVGDDDPFPFLICSPYKHDIGGGGGAVSAPLSSFKYRITMRQCYCIFIEQVLLMEFEWSSLQAKRLKTG